MENENAPAWHSYESVCVDGSWYHTTFIKEVVEQLMKKAPPVQAGLDEYSKAEIFALHILKESNRLSLGEEFYAKGCRW
jgi:ribonuclease HIII